MVEETVVIIGVALLANQGSTCAGQQYPAFFVTVENVFAEDGIRALDYGAVAIINKYIGANEQTYGISCGIDTGGSTMHEL